MRNPIDKQLADIFGWEPTEEDLAWATLWSEVEGKPFDFSVTVPRFSESLDDISELEKTLPLEILQLYLHQFKGFVNYVKAPSEQRAKILLAVMNHVRGDATEPEPPDPNSEPHHSHD